MKKTDNKGFSLVELIVVIAIMAVLIGVLAPTFTKYVERSRKSTDVQNVAAVVTAVQTYAIDPMVKSGEQIGASESITLKYAAAADYTSGTNVKKALEAAGIADIQLKSDKWAVTGTGSAAGEIILTVKNDGTVTVTSNCDPAKNDILKGEYE